MMKRPRLSKILGKRLYSVLYPKFEAFFIRKFTRCSHAAGGKINAKTAIDLLFSKQAKYIRPWQNEEELSELARIVEQLKPRVVLEIGTASGGTLFLASCLATSDALIISIDLPQGKFGGGYPEWRIPLYKKFARNQQRIELIQGDSHSVEVFDQLVNILRGRTIDYLFIDGDHSYEGVRQDYQTYSALLSPKAIVAFHDIVPDRSDPPDHFVSVFWNEIKAEFSYREFVKDPNQSKLGLGVLIVGKSE